MMDYKTACIRKLHEIIGVEMELSEGWWNRHEWDDNQRLLFSEWMVEFLRSDRAARQELMIIPVKNEQVVRRVVTEFIARYGWRDKQTKRREAERR